MRETPLDIDPIDGAGDGSGVGSVRSMISVDFSASGGAACGGGVEGGAVSSRGGVYRSLGSTEPGLHREDSRRLLVPSGDDLRFGERGLRGAGGFSAGGGFAVNNQESTTEREEGKHTYHSSCRFQKLKALPNDTNCLLVEGPLLFRSA